MNARGSVYDTGRHIAHRIDEAPLLGSLAMRALSLTIILLFLVTLMSGCIVRSNRHHHHGNSQARRGNDCPPAYHWNGYKCEHNGRGHAKGHRK
jgi:hypothetical protein